MPSTKILIGNSMHLLPTLPAQSVNTVITSPPYWGLRDYGHSDQLGLEPTPQQYVKNLVAVFRQVWRVALALQADGWYLRQDVIWQKPNPMPESVKDRCVKAHEYVFMLTKQGRYWSNFEAVKESATGRTAGNKTHAFSSRYEEGHGEHRTAANLLNVGAVNKRNKRSVWSISTQPYSGAHFAVMPSALVETCLLASCPVNGVVLDPFGGAGTVGLVASRHQRHSVLLELNHQYAQMACGRIKDDQPLLNDVQICRPAWMQLPPTKQYPLLAAGN